jgi:hypothetical protein
MEREPHRPNYAELKKEPEEVPEPTRPDQVRSPGWSGRGGMAPQQESALKYDQWLKRKQGGQDHEPGAENAPTTPENTPPNEQKTDYKPEEDRDHSRPAEPPADRGEEKKKGDEQEFDAKRFMSDPDYRRQMKEQRQAEQRERKESREQGAELAVSADRQL